MSEEDDGRGEKIHCPGSLSPFCLGMTECNCCGIVVIVTLKNVQAICMSLIYLGLNNHLNLESLSYTGFWGLITSTGV